MPELYHVRLASADKYAILCSDGLLDFFQPSQIA
jgi:hypothetical protein